MNLLKKRKQKMRGEKKIFPLLFHGVAFYVLFVVLIAGLLFSFSVYSSERNVLVSLKENKEYSKGDAMVLEFSSKMLKESVEKGLSFEPALKHEVEWLEDDVIELTLLETAKPETEYQVVISRAKTAWFIPQDDLMVKFDSPSTPKILSVDPSNSATEVEYDKEITMDLEKPLPNDFTLEININPLTGFVHEFNEERTRITIIPKEPMARGVEYSVVVNAKHRSEKDFEKEVYKGTFVTKIPPQIVYSFDKNGNPSRTEEREEDISPQILEGKYIDIDISSQALFIFENGVEKGAFKVSTGKRGMDTPIGTHQVIAKSRRPWSAKYSLYMPWFIQFTYDGHGIHELPEWPGGAKEGTNHLGIPVSHGCVRLGVGPAKVVYDFAEKGTPMIIHQ